VVVVNTGNTGYPKTIVYDSDYKHVEVFDTYNTDFAKGLWELKHGRIENEDDLIAHPYTNELKPMAASDDDMLDPVLISMVRRVMPSLISQELLSIQPMTGPTGLIFALRSRYTKKVQPFYGYAIMME
jgi:hypothetical protein